MTEFYAFLWKFAEGLLAVALPILAVVVVVYLVQRVREMTKDISSNAMYYIEDAARIAVNAAEQVGLAGAIKDKKKYALDLAQEYLDKRGVKINLSLLDGLIEAAVMEQFPHKSDPREMTDR